MIDRGGISMTASAVGYPQVREWVKARLGRTHATVVHTMAWAVLCVLLAQRVTPAAMARALPAWGALALGGGSRLSERFSLCPPPPRGHQFQRAAAVE